MGAAEEGSAAIDAVNPVQERVVDAARIWASLVTNVNYLPGLLTLDYSLKRAESAFPLVALYTDALPKEAHEALDRRGIPKKKVNLLQPSQKYDYGNDPRFYDTWTKLAAFSLIEYDRVVLLDSDMFVLKNMDELIELDLDPVAMHGSGKRVFAASHACVCNPLKKPHYPAEWTPSNCAFTSQHDSPVAAQSTAAPVTASLGLLNSGALVVNPSAAVYGRVATHLAESDAVASYVFPDQDLLADVFRDRWVPLPYVYNALKLMRKDFVHGAIWRDDEVKNVHMILHPKAWDEEPGQETDETHKWWHAINSERKATDIKNGITDGF